MDISKLLEYQTLDSELYKLEKSIRDNPNKKVVSEMSANVKNAQLRSEQLEKKAEELVQEIERIKSQFASQTEKMNQIMTKDTDSLNAEEIESRLSLKDKLSQNLNILDKNLTKLAESINAVLSDFNKTVKVFNASKEKYAASKTAYDNDVKSLEPKMKELEKKLSSLAKGIDAKFMEKYNKRRADNLFPILVPLKDNCCGGCHMQLPSAEISKLRTEGYLSCEHCRRIIYNID